MNSITRSRGAGGRFNLFFIEMIIVLLFFALASAIILRSFAAADRAARYSRRLENMTFCARSAAELYSADGSLAGTAERLFGAGLSGENVSELTLPLTEECLYSQSGGELFVTLTETESGGLKCLRISFSDRSGGELYGIEAGYLPEKEVSE